MILTYSKTVNAEKLHGEISALAIVSFCGVNVLSSGDVQIVFSDTLTQQQQDSVAAVVTAHTVDFPQATAEASVKAGVEFGQNLVREWGIRVGMTGKTQSEINSLLDNLDFLKLGMGIMTGAISFAKDKVDNMTPYTGFTQADKEWFQGKINTFLGV